MPVEGKVDTEPDVYMTDRGTTPNLQIPNGDPHDFEMLEWLTELSGKTGSLAVRNSSAFLKSLGTQCIRTTATLVIN